MSTTKNRPRKPEVREEPGTLEQSVNFDLHPDTHITEEQFRLASQLLREPTAHTGYTLGESPFTVATFTELSEAEGVPRERIDRALRMVLAGENQTVEQRINAKSKELTDLLLFFVKKIGHVEYSATEDVPILGTENSVFITDRTDKLYGKPDFLRYDVDYNPRLEKLSIKVSKRSKTLNNWDHSKYVYGNEQLFNIMRSENRGETLPRRIKNAWGELNVPFYRYNGLSEWLNSMWGFSLFQKENGLFRILGNTYKALKYKKPSINVQINSGSIEDFFARYISTLNDEDSKEKQKMLNIQFAFKHLGYALFKDVSGSVEALDGLSFEQKE
jgi:hypothetical protein